ncbi:MAG: TetR family transcriptional regulator [Trueperaceae bacterium]
MKQPDTTRKTILEAASRVTARDGALSLTLEAVAKEAGVSKGGLLYHFPNKEALISSMIDEHLGNWSKAVEAVKDKDKGAFTRAFVKTTTTPVDLQTQLGAGLLAAVALNPALLKPVQKHYATWQKELGQDGINPVTATLVRLAADGLYFSEVFDLAPPKGKLRKQLETRLLAMTKETSKKETT